MHENKDLQQTRHTWCVIQTQKYIVLWAFGRIGHDRNKAIAKESARVMMNKQSEGKAAVDRKEGREAGSTRGFVASVDG